MKKVCSLLVLLRYVYHDSRFRKVKNAQLYILCISLLIGSYMFRRSCHHDGVYTNAVKTCSNTI